MCEKNTPENAGKSNGQSLAFPTDEYTFFNGVARVGGQHFGFTKREVIAKDLMAAMLSNPAIIDTFTDTAIKSVGYRAVFAADALLAGLSIPQGS